ncbi:MAG: tetratricopeptide repeat protein [Ectothiorhodospiraceae bacterium]|nr:tetratricopeptide repeat protein [Ectothiorhodospiraceae bacterium]
MAAVGAIRRLVPGVVAAALVVLSASPRADQTDPELDGLFERLGAATDVSTARPIEAEIWNRWLRSGDAPVDALMREGMDAMSEGRLDEAIDLFTRIIEARPDFAEGWNKRATAYYLDDQLAASVLDIRRTLALEPRHFGAISGMGLIFLRRGDAAGALDAFERVLDVNPQAPGARARVEMLSRTLRGRGV